MSPQESDTAELRPEHIASTYNEFGTPASMFRCFHCQTIFTVCPVVEPEKHDQWIGCMAEDCASYDLARDGDKLFEAGKVQRVGDRSRFQIVEQGKIHHGDSHARDAFRQQLVEDGLLKSENCKLGGDFPKENETQTSGSNGGEGA